MERAEDGTTPWNAPATVFDSAHHCLHGVLHGNGYGHIVSVSTTIQLHHPTSSLMYLASQPQKGAETYALAFLHYRVPAGCLQGCAKWGVYLDMVCVDCSCASTGEMARAGPSPVGRLWGCGTGSARCCAPRRCQLRTFPTRAACSCVSYTGQRTGRHGAQQHSFAPLPHLSLVYLTARRLSAEPRSIASTESTA